MQLQRLTPTTDTHYCAGYAFSTYGEIVACWLQDIVLALLIVRFKWVAAAFQAACADTLFLNQVHARSRKIDAGTVLASLVFALAFGAIMTDLVSLRLLICKTLACVASD